MAASSRCRPRRSAPRSPAPTSTTSSPSPSAASKGCARPRRPRWPAEAVGLLLATHNAHKLPEFARLLPGVELEALPADAPVPVEDGGTYADNALIKARAAAAATGRAAIADDSG